MMIFEKATAAATYMMLSPKKVKLLVIILILIVVILSGSCSNLIHADAKPLCEKIIQPKSCEFSSCAQLCLEMFHSFRGKCIQNPSKHWYRACACYVC